MNSMNATGSTRHVPNLMVNGVPRVTPKEKAEAFAVRFTSVSSDSNYTQPFLSLKRFMEVTTAELLKKNDEISNEDSINSPLTMSELQAALTSVRGNTALGPDKIAYPMIKNLSPIALRVILKIL